MPFWTGLSLYQKKVTACALMISAVAAACLAIMNVLQAGEPHWVATRSFVRDTITQATGKLDATQLKLESQQTQTEIQVVQGRIESVKSKIKDHTLLLQKQEGPAEYRQAVQEQIEQYQGILSKLAQHLDDLQRQASGRRP